MSKVLFNSGTGKFIENTWRTEAGHLDWSETDQLEGAFPFNGSNPEMESALFTHLNRDQWRKDPSKNQFYFRQLSEVQETQEKEKKP